MGNSFSLKYNDIVYTLPKKSVKFFYGFGIVTPIEECKVDSSYLIGVVDSDYKETLPLTSAKTMPKLEIVPNGTFLFQYYDMDINDFLVWHSNRFGASINLEANDFFRVDHHVYQMDFAYGSALYDGVNCSFLTPCYSVIGPFVDSSFYKRKVAHASYVIVDSDYNVLDEVTSIIASNGELVTPYSSLKTGKEFESRNLQEIVDKIVGKSR